MTFLLQKRDRLDLSPENAVSQPLGGFSENVSAAYEAFKLNDQSYSEAPVLKDQWGPIVDLVNERSGGKSFFNPANYLTSSPFNAAASEGHAQLMYQSYANDLIKFINSNKDQYPELGWVSMDEISKRGMAAARTARQDLQNLEGRSPGVLNTVGRFVGSMGGVATDPFVLEGGLAVRTTGSLYSVMFKEALVNGGLEAMAQTGVKKWYETLGYEYTPEQFWTSVAAAGAFGGAMPLVFKIGGKTISLTSDQMKKGYQAVVDSGAYKPTPVVETAARQADILEADAAANPLVDAAEHQSRMDHAMAALDNNESPPMSDKPNSLVKPMRSATEADNLDGLVYRFNPDEIQVDAQTFQFKAGGDEFGVSERLQGITEWDPIKAGQVTVYEYADGGRFVADGHQRVGLARRIKSQDPTQDVQLYGHLLRETDGITPEMARVIAAVKNISEGTGTAIDAAKVLRVAPERIGELPPRSALVRQAQGLVLLSDEAFGAVVNGIVPANYAALIGRLIPEDEGMQKSAISVLAKTDPANEFQAEAIVRQVRDAGGQKMTQDGLFGEEVITESFFTERARILDRAQKQLRQDKAAFGTLVRNAERLEAEGNQLARQANQKRSDNDTQAIALIQALANTKGPISDALNAAARAARESGSYAEPTRNFVDAIRVATESGDFDRLSTGDVGQFVDAPTQGRQAPDVSERAVDGFDEPAGQGVIDQADQLQNDIFGAADPAPQPVRETRIPDDQVIRKLDLDADDFALIDKRLKKDQNFASLDDLMERGARNHTELTEQIRVATEAAGAVQKVAPFKQRSRVIEKVQSKYKGKIHKVTDAARGGIEAETNEIADAFVDALSKKYKLLDEGYAFTEAGYFDRKLTVIFEDGQLGEVQIWPAGMLEAKEAKGGHKLYQVYRDDAQPEDVRMAAKEGMQQIYSEVAANLSDSWKAVFSRQMSSGIDAPNRAVREATTARVTSGDLSSPSTSAALTEPQLPSSSSRLSITPGDVSMAGIDPSIRKNLIESSSDSIDFAGQNVKVNLDEEIPLDLRVDPETGDVVSQATTLRQIQDDIAQDQKMLDRLRGCAE